MGYLFSDTTLVTELPIEIEESWLERQSCIVEAMKIIVLLGDTDQLTEGASGRADTEMPDVSANLRGHSSQEHNSEAAGNDDLEEKYGSLSQRSGTFRY